MTWQSLVDLATTWKDISNKVDDVETWLTELQTTTDYLSAKGEEYTCLPLLHLIISVLELENDIDPSRLVATLCALGLQLLHLGYTGKAGLAFAKAEALASLKTTSTEAKLHWHLGYAEYLIHMGNITKW